MPVYKAPLKEMRFLLHEVFAYEKNVVGLPGYEEATPDVVDAVLEEAAKFCENELQPLNLSGDKEGCTYENGVVRTPKGFKEAYTQFREGGWCGLTADPVFGGQGLPKVVGFAFEEMITSANMSFGMYPGLSAGAYNALELHGSDELKKDYLPKLVDGTWSGTMCLTEPHCGTDLGLIKTKAIPADDGSFRITGTKIFISAGEHDLTDNILHLVLAKLPDAPPGIKGISLFLVPKFLPKQGANGLEAGPSNGVRCGSIEHKMGIKASATCVINFDESKGWLVGHKHKGMRAMFAMMNAARLGVAMQGLAIAEVAYQNGANYARDRLQGRSLKGAKFPDKPADPILVHPDVRRMLLKQRAVTEAARALAYWSGMQLDVFSHHPDPAVRAEADDFVALMTPIMKAFFTDHGFAAANDTVQVHGGHGYIHEYGVEQFARDARIAQIYEGANGIQALDLIGRKLPMGGGRLLRRFFHPMQAFLEENMADPALAEFTSPLVKAFSRLQQLTLWVAQQGLADPEEAGAAASEYLRFFGLVSLGWMWCRMVKAAQAKIAADEDPEGFYADKLAVARFFFQKLLPETAALGLSIMAGKKPMMELKEAAF
ncbi:MAG: acyl-CoA dehydrogenase C-terminal domain-containing protein [Rhodospirillaceae bacterium]|nr:acyl-CoA dehydrogenase C-terminal domain-containing protein [Rhodospirillaceae bacterium]